MKACTGPDALKDPGPGRDSGWSSRKTSTWEEGSEVTTVKPSELRSRAETVSTVGVPRRGVRGASITEEVDLERSRVGGGLE